MRSDVHITTCHHSTVRCRDRTGLPSWTNITSWTPEERLEISKVSLQSITSFVKVFSLSRFSLLDDGSDNTQALQWMDSLTNVHVIHKPHRGSSAAINDYVKDLDCDLVFHIEDDHVLFNPLNLKVDEICYEILTSQTAKDNNIGVITLRSGLPSSSNSPGIHGAWGPRGFVSFGQYSGILYNCLGNAHHIMLRDTYLKFFPLSGSSGGCESFMNQKMAQMGIKNIELQAYVYAFHSHKLSYPIDIHNVTSEEWNRSADGFEYGIADMHQYLRDRLPITCSKYIVYPGQKESLLFQNTYAY